MCVCVCVQVAELIILNAIMANASQYSVSVIIGVTTTAKTCRTKATAVSIARIYNCSVQTVVKVAIGSRGWGCHLGN